MLKVLLPLSYPKFSYDVTPLRFAPHYIFVDDKSLETHRPTSVYPSCTDANFSSEAITESICETRASIDKSPCGVHASAEYRRCTFTLGYDRIRVMGGMRVDELNCGMKGGQSYDGYRKIKVFNRIG
jgi:hypothetical protein